MLIWCSKNKQRTIQEQHLFEMIFFFCYNVKVFTESFDLFNVPLPNIKNTYLTDPKLLNTVKNIFAVYCVV